MAWYLVKHMDNFTITAISSGDLLLGHCSLSEILAVVSCYVRHYSVLLTYDN